MFLSLLPAVLLAVRFARAANDWSVPCLDGRCSYDLQNGTARGTLTLIGSSLSLSDITPAAGWTILDCDPNAIAQDIRLVCTGDEETCNHVYEGGAAQTLVRLPENCGQVPFARVAKAWVHKDQSVPASVAKKLQRRQDGSSPTVRGLALDTNWSAVDPKKNGNITMLISGANAGDFTAAPDVALRSLERRDLIEDIKETLKNISTIDFEKEGKAAPVNIDKSFTLLDQSIDCPASGDAPAIKESVKIGVDAKAHADIGYGIAAVGTVVPPSLTEFGIFANVNATLDGAMNIDAAAAVTFDSGKVAVFTQGIPGLDFKQFLTIGPSFVVNVEGIASLDAQLNMTVNLAYNVTGAKLFFPPQAGSSSGDVAPADSNLKLSADPSGNAKATLEAHVIPGVAFGISVLGGKLAEATINLDVDASAKLGLNIEGSTEVSTTKGNNNATAAAYKNAGNGTGTNAGKNSSFTGCVDLSAGVAVTAGADGNLLGIFDKSTSVTLVEKEFDLFKKCFGNASAGNTTSTSTSSASSTSSTSKAANTSTSASSTTSTSKAASTSTSTDKTTSASTSTSTSANATATDATRQYIADYAYNYGRKALRRHILPVVRKHPRDIRRRGLVCTPSLGGVITDVVNEVVSAKQIASTVVDVKA